MVGRFFLALWLFIRAGIALDCSTASLSSILPSNCTVTFAQQITHTGEFSKDGIIIKIPFAVPSSTFPICAVNIKVQSSPNTTFNSGILLPSNWNGRMMATGNPGFGGGMRWDFMGSSMNYGPAVTTSTDTGHIGPPNGITWAIHNPEGVIDWSYRSLHYTTVLAKQVANAFYGKPVRHAYYTACSNGGRQGMKEIQMYPGDYDGVVVGAPPWWITHLHPWALQVGLWNLPSSSSAHITSQQVTAVGTEVMKQCDHQDGVADGIVSKPYSCNFDSSALLCSNSGSSSTTCLNSTQLGTVSKIYNDWLRADGSLLFPGFPISASASRYADVTTSPNHFGLEYMQGFVYNETAWNWHTFSGEKTVNFVDSINAGQAAALSTDLSKFQANGGKLIIYHGLADTTVPTSSSLLYYQKVKQSFAATNPGTSIDDFFKFYLVPGMGHCGGSTVAPYYIAAAGQIVKTSSGTGFSTPGYVDTKHDVLLAMMDWVEHNNAPDHIIASKWVSDNATNGLSMQRPLCPYPEQQKFIGGNYKAAGAWTCISGTEVDFPLPKGSQGTVSTTTNKPVAQRRSAKFRDHPQ
ncbi:MAG: hypothetical protein GOMPHAMPRED_007915 [Gomphillus americanus]|uniref:Carboxylic ester hydrolase n=1 Tax=Gomphillus americanus TaxID=1940652 RepID=A0A8H3EXI6_9LECA|nr:MAG: hypothetical protein GOMPHAMPRED_007915 [Gomphillus americanus]